MEEDYTSIKIIRLYMKLIGMWHTDNPRQEYIYIGLIVYISMTCVVAGVVTGLDFYHSLGNLYAISNATPCTETTALALGAMVILTRNRRKLIQLGKYMNENLWRSGKNPVAADVLKKCNRHALWTIAIFLSISQLMVVHYVSGPIFDTMDENVTKKALPFNLWISQKIIPYNRTPYYEMVYTVQSLATVSVGVTTASVGIFFCTTNIYTAGQLEILQINLGTLCEIDSEKFSIDVNDEVALTCTIYEKLKEYIKRHLILISVIEQMEDMYCYIMLAQALSSTSLICLTGFQLVTVSDMTTHRWLLCCEYFLAINCQFFLFSWGCYQVIMRSLEVADGAYNANWHSIPYAGKGKDIRDGLMLIILRSHRACSLSVGKFCPLSLETFASVLSTAMSYFTVLRQVSEEED